jgi:hypothetical protein
VTPALTLRLSDFLLTVPSLEQNHRFDSRLCFILRCYGKSPLLVTLRDDSDSTSRRPTRRPQTPRALHDSENTTLVALDMTLGLLHSPATVSIDQNTTETGVYCPAMLEPGDLRDTKQGLEMSVLSWEL